MARPRNPPPDPAVLEAIFDKLADGVPLKVICRQPGMPNVRRVYEWRAADEEFAAELQLARDAGDEAVDAEILDIVDAPIAKNSFGSVDNGEVQNRKLRVWAREQIRARRNPKRNTEREADPAQAIAEVLAQLAGRLPG